MDFDFNPASSQYKKISSNNTDFLNKYNENNGDNSEEKLKEAVSQFSSIFLHQMFISMRSTVPESELLDGGFAEDVFNDMLDQEISKIGSKQSSFSGLNKILFQQLNQKNG